MSIVFVNCTADTFTPTKSGAISTWIWEVLQEAKKDGTQPLLITRSASASPWPWERTILLEYPRIPPIRGAGRLFMIQKKLTGWGHVRQRPYAERVAEAIRRSGSQNKVLFLHNDIELAVFLREQFPHACIIHHFHNNNPSSKRFRERFAGAVNVATAVTDFCARWNEDYYGVKVHTLYSGINATTFRPADEPPGAVAPGAVPVVNFVGRTDPPKGPDLLLRAAKRVTSRTRQFGIQILGRNHYDRSQPDEFQDMLESLANELEREGVKVRRPGWVDRAGLPGELRKAHIHCIPARWDEPFGLTTLEGMACGLATVASRTGGTPEVVGEAGFLFERESVEELADRLHDLVADPGLRRRYAQMARERALEMGWDRTWARFKELAGI